MRALMVIIIDYYSFIKSIGKL